MARFSTLPPYQESGSRSTTDGSKSEHGWCNRQSFSSLTPAISYSLDPLEHRTSPSKLQRTGSGWLLEYIEVTHWLTKNQSNWMTVGGESVSAAPSSRKKRTEPASDALSGCSNKIFIVYKCNSMTSKKQLRRSKRKSVQCLDVSRASGSTNFAWNVQHSGIRNGSKQCDFPDIASGTCVDSLSIKPYCFGSGCAPDRR